MKRIHIRYYVRSILISIMLTGCRIAGINYEQEQTSDNMTQVSEIETLQTETLEIEASERETSEIEEAETQDVQEIASSQSFNKSLSYEQLDAYQQMALYIQEGFRTYKVDGVYQAYFGEIKSAIDEENRYYCEIMLEDEENVWIERITYTYDAEKNWYTFGGNLRNKYEPILSGYTFGIRNNDSDFITDMKENNLYTALISQTIDATTPIHYYGESGPVENDAYMYFPHYDKRDNYSVYNNIYTYTDERMDINITIEYPQIHHYDDELEDIVNEKIKEAFFYGYYGDESLIPQNEMYSTIERQYFITRQDNDYLSMRIYEDNYTYGAAHPNDWETGISINMHTGEVLTLTDIVGAEWTPATLLESGAFKGLWHWENGTDESWVEEIFRYSYIENYTLSDYDEYFYLTDDALGLITRVSRYYTCMEAEFEDLGIEGY